MFKKNRDYGSEAVEEDFLDDDECLSAETECLSVEDGDLLDEAECLLDDEEEEVCVSDADEAEEVAGEVGADTVMEEVVAGVDFVDDDLAGETAPL